MSNMSRSFATVFLIVVIVPIVLAMLFERVPPSEIGIRQDRFGGGGLDSQDYTTGTYLGITGYHLWHYLPRRTHFLHFSSTRLKGSNATTSWQQAMELRTRDNNQTTIDVTIPYRIKEGEGWRIVDKGLKGVYVDRVKSRVQDVLRGELSKLSSEDLQSTELRLKESAEVLPLLNDKLADLHVVAESVLIRAVRFLPEYEAKLQEKQYFTQKALLDGALALQANEEQVTNSIEKQIGAEIKKISAEWDKRIQEERSRYEVLIAKIAAEAKVYESRVRAEGAADQVSFEAAGQLAIDTATALRDKLRNAVLDSKGGRIYLALEAARNVQLSNVTLNSNDPRVPLVLDLDELSAMLLGSATGEQP